MKAASEDLLEFLTREEQIEKIPEWLKKRHPTLHFCYEFDGLAIDCSCYEWNFCSCLPKEIYEKYPKHGDRKED